MKTVGPIFKSYPRCLIINRYDPDSMGLSSIQERFRTGSDLMDLLGGTSRIQHPIHYGHQERRGGSHVGFKVEDLLQGALRRY